jgi:hypothetical protein
MTWPVFIEGIFVSVHCVVLDAALCRDHIYSYHRRYALLLFRWRWHP